MTKMAVMPIYGKNFSGIGGPISTKLGLEHQELLLNINSLYKS